MQECLFFCNMYVSSSVDFQALMDEEEMGMGGEPHAFYPVSRTCEVQ